MSIADPAGFQDPRQALRRMTAHVPERQLGSSSPAPSPPPPPVPPKDERRRQSSSLPVVPPRDELQRQRLRSSPPPPPVPPKDDPVPHVRTARSAPPFGTPNQPTTQLVPEPSLIAFPADENPGLVGNSSENEPKVVPPPHQEPVLERHLGIFTNRDPFQAGASASSFSQGEQHEPHPAQRLSIDQTPRKRCSVWVSLSRIGSWLFNDVDDEAAQKAEKKAQKKLQKKLKKNNKKNKNREIIVHIKDDGSSVKPLEDVSRVTAENRTPVTAKRKREGLVPVDQSVYIDKDAQYVSQPQAPSSATLASRVPGVQTDAESLPHGDRESFTSRNPYAADTPHAAPSHSRSLDWGFQGRNQAWPSSNNGAAYNRNQRSVQARDTVRPDSSSSSTDASKFGHASNTWTRAYSAPSIRREFEASCFQRPGQILASSSNHGIESGRARSMAQMGFTPIPIVCSSLCETTSSNTGASTNDWTSSSSDTTLSDHFVNAPGINSGIRISVDNSTSRTRGSRDSGASYTPISPFDLVGGSSQSSSPSQAFTPNAAPTNPDFSDRNGTGKLYSQWTNDAQILHSGQMRAILQGKSVQTTTESIAKSSFSEDNTSNLHPSLGTPVQRTNGSGSKISGFSAGLTGSSELTRVRNESLGDGLDPLSPGRGSDLKHNSNSLVNTHNSTPGRAIPDAFSTIPQFKDPFKRSESTKGDTEIQKIDQNKPEAGSNSPRSAFMKSSNASTEYPPILKKAGSTVDGFNLWDTLSPRRSGSSRSVSWAEPLEQGPSPSSGSRESKCGTQLPRYYAVLQDKIENVKCRKKSTGTSLSAELKKVTENGKRRKSSTCTNLSTTSYAKVKTKCKCCTRYADLKETFENAKRRKISSSAGASSSNIEATRYLTGAERQNYDERQARVFDADAHTHATPIGTLVSANTGPSRPSEGDDNDDGQMIYAAEEEKNHQVSRNF